MKIPKKISETIKVQNPYLKVTEKIFQDANGTTNSFLIMSNNKKHSCGTFVLPVTAEWKILYLKEFRYGPEKIVINFPVGMLEDGVSPIQNAKNELEEETGYTSDQIEFLGETIVENYLEWKSVYFIAKNCYKIAHAKPELWEYLEVHEAGIEQFEQMIFQSEVQDSKTAFCFLLARARGLI